MPTVGQLGAVIGAVVAVVLLAHYGVVPVSELAQGEITVTLTQSAGNQATSFAVHGALNSTVTAADTAGPNATVELEDTDTFATANATIGEATTSTITVSDVAVDTTVEEVIDATTVRVTYELSRDAYLSPEAKNLVTPVMTLVLALLVALLLTAAKGVVD